MSKQNQRNVIQTNHAKEQRNAARDYHEKTIYKFSEGANSYLPDAKLDLLAADNEAMFRQRFGFDATPTVRTQVLAIKNQYELSNREMFWQYLSGHLVITRKEAKLKPNSWMPLVGQTQVALFSVLYLLLALQISFSPAPEWKLGLAVAGTVGSFLGMLWIMNAFYITPWYTLKRSGAI